MFYSKHNQGAELGNKQSIFPMFLNVKNFMEYSL